MRLRNLKDYDYWIILPDDKFKPYWDIIIAIFVFIVSLTTPARIAFTENDTIGWVITDSLVDFVFLLDLVLNFFFAYYDDEFMLVDDRKTITTSYLRSWFVVDLIAIIPVSVIFQFTDINSVLRVTKATRLYRIVKLVRLVRMLKLVRERRKIQKYMHDVFKIGESFEHLLLFLLVFILFCHVACCLWVASARFDDFGPDTWVMRYDFKDLSSVDLYIASFYFTITTITTVGFGDVSGGTTAERIICIFLMLAGVIAFSFATGTLSSIIASFDSSKAKLKEKMTILQELRTEYCIGQQLYDELCSAVKFDHKRNKGSTTDFVNELPYRLRIELAAKIHQKMISNIPFFREKQKDVIAFIGPLLRAVRINQDQYIYRTGEPVMEIYFLRKGEAAFVLPKCNDLAYVLVEEGDAFGIIDLVVDSNSGGNVQEVEKELRRKFTV